MVYQGTTAEQVAHVLEQYRFSMSTTDTFEYMVQKLAKVFEADPRFDAQKFIEKCGLERAS